MNPHRVQLRRTKGWRKPPDTVVVARPSKWGNPFRVYPGTHTVGDICKVWGSYSDGRPNPHATTEAVRLYRLWITGELSFEMTGCRIPPDSPLQPSSFQYEGTSGAFVPTWPKVARFQRPAIANELDELRGQNLACWCSLDQPCHADVLLDLANRETP